MSQAPLADWSWVFLDSFTLNVMPLGDLANIRIIPATAGNTHQGKTQVPLGGSAATCPRAAGPGPPAADIAPDALYEEVKRHEREL